MLQSVYTQNISWNLNCLRSATDPRRHEAFLVLRRVQSPLFNGARFYTLSSVKPPIVSLDEKLTRLEMTSAMCVCVSVNSART